MKSSSKVAFITSIRFSCFQKCKVVLNVFNDCEVAMRGQKVLVNGVKLYYERVGGGPHVVLLCPGILGKLKAYFV